MLPVSRASHSSRPTRPTHRVAESRRAHHAARHGHGGLVVRWAAGSRSAEQSSRAARRGEAVSARGRGASTPRPFLPHAPSFPGPTGGPPLRSGSERRSPAWRPPAATAPALRTAQQGAAMWGRQGLCCPHCVRDDYGDQRERSGIARVAVPRRAGPESLGTQSAAHLGAGPSFASIRFGGQTSCPRRGRRRGSASSIDARRGLTGILLRPGGSSASLARPTQHRCRPTLRRPPASPRAASSRKAPRLEPQGKRREMREIFGRFEDTHGSPHLTTIPSSVSMTS